MAERERLIELLKNVPRNTRAFYDQFADYLLENGVIVPPCKVGDMVYYKTFWNIHKGKCHAITRHKNSLQIHLKNYIGETESFASDSVFLTKEEAEKAFKTRGKE